MAMIKAGRTQLIVKPAFVLPGSQKQSIGGYSGKIDRDPDTLD